jgi:hypothetical protein
MTRGSISRAGINSPGAAGSENALCRWHHIHGSATLLGGAFGCRTDGSRGSRQPPRVPFVQVTAWQRT